MAVRTFKVGADSFSLARFTRWQLRTTYRSRRDHGASQLEARRGATDVVGAFMFDQQRIG